MELDREDFDELFEENENDGAAGSTENKGSTEGGSEAVKVPVHKRIVKNPRLKFNPERLCGERGIPILVDHFKDVKFKGKGYEKEDLDKLLSHLELWTHRLFPSMKFEDCLNQIEKLGKKRPVQTCLRKIRLDMPILSSDFVKDDEEEDNVQRNDDPEPFPEDPFDRLVGESRDLLNSDVSVTENLGHTNSVFSSPMASSSQGQVLGSSFGPDKSLTEEQKERMERNRLLAAERRRSKLESTKLNMPNSQPTDYETSNSQSISFSDKSIQKLDLSDVAQSKEQENEENTLVVDTDQSCSEKDIGYAMDMSDQNAEHLGLDDLMDLVDEEERESHSYDANGTNIVVENEHHPIDSSKIPTLSVEEIKSHPNNINEEDIVMEKEHATDSYKNPTLTIEESKNHSSDINEENTITKMDSSTVALEQKESHINNTTEENIMKKNEHPTGDSLFVSTPVSDNVENTDISMLATVKLCDTLENVKSELMSLDSMLDLVEE